jgi:hypothetical protein
MGTVSRYTDSYKRTLRSTIIGGVSSVTRFLPSRLRSFLLYLFVSDLHRDMSLDLQSKFGSKINSRLFEGIKFEALLSDRTMNFDLGVSMVMGTWEQQVQDWILESGPFDLFIDVGAANGLYPVALLKKAITKKAVAFETIEISRQSIALLAKDNQVLVDVRGEFSLASFPKLKEDLLKSGKTLWMLDIEGAETKVLTNAVLEEIYHYPSTSMIIEMHPHLSGQIENDALASRLGQYFNVSALDSNSKTIPADMLEYMNHRPDWEIYLSLAEQRQVWMKWLVCSPRSSEAREAGRYKK